MNLAAMNLSERLRLPAGYTARRYGGAADHPAMVAVLNEYREHLGEPEMSTVEQFDLTYSHLEGCDAETDIAIVESAGEVVAYCRASYEDMEHGTRDCIVFAPVLVAHLRQPLFMDMVRAQEGHMASWSPADGAGRYRAYAPHPGPGLAPKDEAAWLEDHGYAATEWNASLRRPHLDDVPDRPLPAGVEVRPVREPDVRTILTAHFEAFRGEWDFHEPNESDFVELIDDPYRDITLWQVAWAGDEVVGQVKPFINHDENAARNVERGYAEHISTHHDWRNRGIAGALLARALQALRGRGVTEAVLGVDTNNPGGAFQLYTGLGFELQSYEAVYTKPLSAR